MTQKMLFSKPKESMVVNGRKFVRVDMNDYELFRQFGKKRKYIAYHAFSVCFMYYWNMRVYSLFINEDAVETGELIPIAKKHKNVSSYYIVDPIVNDFETVLNLCESLSEIATKGVYVSCIHEANSSVYLESDKFEKYGSVEKEFIYSTDEQVELKGSKFKKARKHLSQFKKSNNLEVRLITEADIPAHEKFLDKWMQEVGPGYFRPSVLKDRNLIRLVANGDDYDFTLAAFDGEDMVGICSCSIEPDTGIMCGIYQKCLRGYTNLSQYIEHECSVIGQSRGAKIENDASASASSPGIRKHKLARRPYEFWKIYSFKYI